MLGFNFFMPTRIIHGSGCVGDNSAEFGRLGKRALIVTGPNSGKRSGALEDVEAVLKAQGMDYQVYDQVENNPSLENVTEGGLMARRFAPAFIVAIGGGSPLDAAKAVAVLAVNDIDASGLYDGSFATTPLPIMAIPTTAGTGSEVTPYSVLTLKEKQTKKGFGGPDLFPRIAFLDPRYTQSLPVGITVDTGVDALSHLVEGYLAKRANDASDMLAERGIKVWGTCYEHLSDPNMSASVRDGLLVASALGGMTISHTGTTFVHALGYSLTYFHDLPHGRANGVLMGEYLRYTQSVAPQRVDNVLRWLGLDTVAEFSALMHKLFSDRPRLSRATVETYARTASKAKNIANSIGDVTEDVLREVLAESLC